MNKELDKKWLELHDAGKVSWVSPMRERAEGCRFYRYPGGDRTQAIWITEETPYENVRALLWPLLTSKYEEEADELDVPDWGDPATLGCLLGQVRKRWKDDRISSVFNLVYGTWMLLMPLFGARAGGKRLIGCGRTEAETLLAALEAAP